MLQDKKAWKPKPPQEVTHSKKVAEGKDLEDGEINQDNQGNEPNEEEVEEENEVDSTLENNPTIIEEVQPLQNIKDIWQKVEGRGKRRKNPSNSKNTIVKESQLER